MPYASCLILPYEFAVQKNLSIQRFSSFNSTAVQNKGRLSETLRYLQEIIEDPMFRTKVGKTFRLHEIADAMTYESTSGAKAVLLPDQA